MNFCWWYQKRWRPIRAGGLTCDSPTWPRPSPAQAHLGPAFRSCDSPSWPRPSPPSSPGVTAPPGPAPQSCVTVPPSLTLAPPSSPLLCCGLHSGAALAPQASHRGPWGPFGFGSAGRTCGRCGSHPACAPGREGKQEEARGAALRLARALLQAPPPLQTHLCLPSRRSRGSEDTGTQSRVTGSKDPEHRGLSGNVSKTPAAAPRPSPALYPVLKGRLARLRLYHEKVPKPQARGGGQASEEVAGPRWERHGVVAAALRPVLPCHSTLTEEAVGPQTAPPAGPAGKIGKK